MVLETMKAEITQLYVNTLIQKEQSNSDKAFALLEMKTLRVEIIPSEKIQKAYQKHLATLNPCKDLMVILQTDAYSGTMHVMALAPQLFTNLPKMKTKWLCE